MTPDSTALDAAIRQARHLLFAFDGPVRSVDKAKSIGSGVVTALTSAYLHDALAACHESGRSVAVISADLPTEVHDYLNAHDLSTQVAVVAVSIGEAVSTLEAAPVDCPLITSSPADIEAAQASGTPTIGYARTRASASRASSSSSRAGDGRPGADSCRRRRPCRRLLGEGGGRRGARSWRPRRGRTSPTVAVGNAPRSPGRPEAEVPAKLPSPTGPDHPAE
jgi:hypothetical protein